MAKLSCLQFFSFGLVHQFECFVHAYVYQMHFPICWNLFANWIRHDILVRIWRLIKLIKPKSPFLILFYYFFVWSICWIFLMGFWVYVRFELHPFWGWASNPHQTTFDVSNAILFWQIFLKNNLNIDLNCQMCVPKQLTFCYESRNLLKPFLYPSYKCLNNV